MRIRGTAESFTFRHRILETCCHRNKFQVFSFIDISSITKLQKIGFFDFCTLHFTASNASFVKPDYPSKVAYHFLIVHRSDKKLQTFANVSVSLRRIKIQREGECSKLCGVLFSCVLSSFENFMTGENSA